MGGLAADGREVPRAERARERRVEVFVGEVARSRVRGRGDDPHGEGARDDEGQRDARRQAAREGERAGNRGQGGVKRGHRKPGGLAGEWLDVPGKDAGSPDS